MMRFWLVEHQKCDKNEYVHTHNQDWTIAHVRKEPENQPTV